MLSSMKQSLTRQTASSSSETWHLINYLSQVIAILYRPLLTIQVHDSNAERRNVLTSTGKVSRFYYKCQIFLLATG